MCKLWNCENDDCHHCLHQAERAKKKPLKRTPLKKKDYKIKRESSKRAKQNREYSKQRKRILAERPICECGRVDEDGRVCDKPATEIHHQLGRIGSLLNDERYMLPINHECHSWATEHSKEAIEQGLSLRRNVEISKRIK